MKRVGPEPHSIAPSLTLITIFADFTLDGLLMVESAADTLGHDYANLHGPPPSK
ncbi:MAG: hypothetical protein ABGZ49_01410 [Akkermansiaceae bacterium]